MRKIYLLIISIVLLTACSNKEGSKILKPKKEVKAKSYSCKDIDSIVHTSNFNVKLLTNLYKKCPTQKVKVALLIAKGDNQESALESYQEALRLIKENNLELFDEYKLYLKNQIKKYSQHNKQNRVVKSGVISSEALEGYIMPRANDSTRDAMIGEFSTVKGIPLNFSSGSSAIKEGVNLAQAKEIGKLLSKKDFANRVVYITGYTDTRGDSQSNQELSVQRANGLKRYLINNFNLKEENIRAEGYGESFPICKFGEKQKVDREYSCSQEENYAKSRRVTLEYGE